MENDTNGSKRRHLVMKLCTEERAYFNYKKGAIKLGDKEDFKDSKKKLRKQS